MTRLLISRSAVLCAAVLCCWSCSELNPPKPTPRRTVWKSVGTWTGHGSLQTGSFDISVFRWRARWQTVKGKATSEAVPDTGHFALTFNSAVSGRNLGEIPRSDGPGEGTAEFTEDPHLLYMVIDSSNLDWSVTVEEPIEVGGVNR